MVAPVYLPAFLIACLLNRVMEAMHSIYVVGSMILLHKRL